MWIMAIRKTMKCTILFFCRALFVSDFRAISHVAWCGEAAKDMLDEAPWLRDANE